MAIEITAQQIVERIQQHLGVLWTDSAKDVFYAGSPDMAITGIATTFTPTLDVLRRAVAEKWNLIITRERAFYHKGLANENIQADPTYRLKRAFVEDNDLVIAVFGDQNPR